MLNMDHTRAVTRPRSLWGTQATLIAAWQSSTQRSTDQLSTLARRAHRCMAEQHTTIDGPAEHSGPPRACAARARPAPGRPHAHDRCRAGQQPPPPTHTHAPVESQAASRLCQHGWHGSAPGCTCPHAEGISPAGAAESPTLPSAAQPVPAALLQPGVGGGGGDTQREPSGAAIIKTRPAPVAGRGPHAAPAMQGMMPADARPMTRRVASTCSTLVAAATPAVASDQSRSPTRSTLQAAGAQAAGRLGGQRLAAVAATARWCVRPAGWVTSGSLRGDRPAADCWFAAGGRPRADRAGGVQPAHRADSTAVKVHDRSSCASPGTRAHLVPPSLSASTPLGSWPAKYAASMAACTCPA